MLGTPVPARTLKLTNIEPGPYLDGRILGSSWRCLHSFIHKNCFEASGQIWPPCCWMFLSKVDHLQAARPRPMGTQNLASVVNESTHCKNVWLMHIYISQSRVFLQSLSHQFSFKIRTNSSRAWNRFELWILCSTAHRSRTFRSNEGKQCQQT